MTRILTDVPDSEVDEVVADFESEEFTVTKTKQPDGNWTVVGTKAGGRRKKTG